MADARVTCITKPNCQSAHEHITHLCGSDWRWTREAVIASIDAKTNTFHKIDANATARQPLMTAAGEYLR